MSEDGKWEYITVRGRDVTFSQLFEAARSMSETRTAYNASGDAEYEKRHQKFEAILKPLLTPEFLYTLMAAVKTCGWTVDHIESAQFVRWCFRVAGEDAPDLTPYGEEAL